MNVLRLIIGTAYAAIALPVALVVLAVVYIYYKLTGRDKDGMFQMWT